MNGPTVPPGMPPEGGPHASGDPGSHRAASSDFAVEETTMILTPARQAPRRER